MKRLILVLPIFFLLSSCGCLIAQIPPQTIYINENCEAVLPNYLNNVTVTDNCELDTVMQFPEAGYILNSTTPTVDVTITAIDEYSNTTEMIFTVTAVDTIAPIIEPDSTIVNSLHHTTKGFLKLYHQSVLRELQFADAHMEDSVRAQLLEATGDSTLTQDWYDNSLAIFCPSGNALENEGVYYSVFYPDSTVLCACDTITGEVVGTLVDSF